MLSSKLVGAVVLLSAIFVAFYVRSARRSNQPPALGWLGLSDVLESNGDIHAAGFHTTSTMCIVDDKVASFDQTRSRSYEAMLLCAADRATEL